MLPETWPEPMPQSDEKYGGRKRNRRKQDTLVPDEYTEPELIRHLLERLGITTPQLAQLLGVTPGCVYKWKYGRAKLHGSAVRLIGLLMEVPNVLVWLLEARELLHGPLPKEHKPTYTRVNYSNGEIAPWPEQH